MHIDFRDIPLKKIFLDGTSLLSTECFRIGLYDDPQLSLHWQLAMSCVRATAITAIDVIFSRAPDVTHSHFIRATANLSRRRPGKLLRKWEYESVFHLQPESDTYTVEWFGAGNDRLVGPQLPGFPGTRMCNFTDTVSMLSTELLLLETKILSPLDLLVTGLK